jgi:hypothetical protein
MMKPLPIYAFITKLLKANFTASLKLSDKKEKYFLLIDTFCRQLYFDSRHSTILFNLIF